VSPGSSRRKPSGHSLPGGKDKVQGLGAGRKLVDNAVFQAERQGLKGVVVKAYYNDNWFMPVKFSKCLQNQEW